MMMPLSTPAQTIAMWTRPSFRAASSMRRALEQKMEQGIVSTHSMYHFARYVHTCVRMCGWGERGQEGVC